MMDRICIGIKYTMHPETNEYTWDFAGGCYEDLGDALNKEKDGVNDFVHYVPGKVGETYNFENIPIEVRQVSSGALEEVTGSSSNGAGILRIISFLSVIAFIVSFSLLVVKLYKKNKTS